MKIENWKFMLFSKGKQSHDACALDRARYLALMGGAQARFALWHNLRKVRHKPLKGHRIFIGYAMEIIDAEVAVFFYWLRLLIGRRSEGHSLVKKSKLQISNYK